MKTTKILLAATIFAGATFFSCSKEDNSQAEEASNAVKFTASIHEALPGSRASNTTWDANDAIGVSMVENATTPIAIVNGTVNRQYTTLLNDGNFANATNPIYYPVSGALVDFIAYYPYRADAIIGADATNIGTYPIDVVNQATPATIDLMWANTVNGHSKVTVGGVPLSFNHQLTKLVMNCVPGDGITLADLEGMTVSINGMFTQNTFNLATGVLGATPTEPLAITPQTVTAGVRYEAIILPSVATTTLGQYNVTFTINPGTATPETFTWNMAVGTDFLAGNEYTYTVTISRVAVTAAGTINAWTATVGGPVTAQ